MRNKLGLGQKKDFNADLNLTPFIDLLSTCVCFLLITAVWIEIGSVEIKQSHGTQADAAKKMSYDLDLIFRNPTYLTMNLKRSGKRIRSLKVKGADKKDFQKKLEMLLQTKMLNYKNQPIELSSATVTPRRTVNYGSLVETLDTLRGNNIMNIGVLSAKRQ